jgi:hypothetical protein
MLRIAVQCHPYRHRGGTELRSFAEQISGFRGTAETMSISSWEGATSRGSGLIELLRFLHGHCRGFPGIIDRHAAWY